jgi:hypothetical protein
LSDRRERIARRSGPEAGYWWGPDAPRRRSGLFEQLRRERAGAEGSELVCELPISGGVTALDPADNGGELLEAPQVVA